MESDLEIHPGWAVEAPLDTESDFGEPANACDVANPTTPDAAPANMARVAAPPPAAGRLPAPLVRLVPPSALPFFRLAANRC